MQQTKASKRQSLICSERVLTVIRLHEENIRRLAEIASAHFASEVAGKTHTRKPPLSLTIPVGDDVASRLAISPQWDSSAKKLNCNRLRLELITSRHDRPVRDLSLLAGETIRPTSWSLEYGEEAAEVLVSTVAGFLERPQSVFARASDHCCMCRRSLTDGCSRARGIGPECLQRSLSIIKQIDERRRVESVVVGYAFWDQNHVTLYQQRDAILRTPKGPCVAMPILHWLMNATTPVVLAFNAGLVEERQAWCVMAVPAARYWDHLQDHRFLDGRHFAPLEDVPLYLRRSCPTQKFAVQAASFLDRIFSSLSRGEVALGVFLDWLDEQDEPDWLAGSWIPHHLATEPVRNGLARCCNGPSGPPGHPLPDQLHFLLRQDRFGLPPFTWLAVIHLAMDSGWHLSLPRWGYTPADLELTDHSAELLANALERGMASLSIYRTFAEAWRSQEGEIDPPWWTRLFPPALTDSIDDPGTDPYALLRDDPDPVHSLIDWCRGRHRR